MHAEAEIKFECSACGQHLSVDATGAGLATICPSCHESLVVPQTDVVTRIAAITNASGGLDTGEEWDHQTNQSLEPENSALRAQLIDAARTRARMERDLAAARHEIEGLQSQIQQSVEENSHLVASLGQLQSENRELTEYRSELLSREKQLQQRVATQEQEIAQKADTLRNLEAALAREKDQRERTAGELAALRDEEKRLRERVTVIDPLEKEVANLKKDLAASTDAQECSRLRLRAEAAEEDQKKTLGDIEKIRAEMAQLTNVNGGLQKGLSEAKERCASLEQQVKELNESKVKADNEVLRSILGRQKTELETCYRDLNRLRRAQIGLRLAYALFALGLLGIAMFAMHVMPDITEIL